MAILHLATFVLCVTLAQSLYRLCPYPWVSYQDQCYLFNTGAVTNAEFEDICIDEGGYQVEIQDETESSFLKKTLNSLYGDASDYAGARIGLVEKSGGWMWARSLTGIYSDTYSDWAESAPSNGGCVMMSPDYDWQWVQVDCEPDPAPNVIYVCEMGYTIQDCDGDMCYTIYEEDIYTYVDIFRCETEGEYVARIDSEGEMEEVKDFLVEAETILTDDVAREWYQGILISGYLADDGVWYYGTSDSSVEDEELTYFNWASGEPQSGSDCILLDPNDDYKMRATRCEQIGIYLCETPNPLLG